MTVTEAFIRRPVMTVLLSASFVVAGLLAYADIPIAALPRFETPVISVYANLPGASPDTMATSVALPLEKQFATIAGVDAISSTSTQGRTSITLEEEFWTALKVIAVRRGCSLAALIGLIDAARLGEAQRCNLSSAIRVFVLRDMRERDSA